MYTKRKLSSLADEYRKLARVAGCLASFTADAELDGEGKPLWYFDVVAIRALNRYRELEQLLRRRSHELPEAAPERDAHFSTWFQHWGRLEAPTRYGSEAVIVLGESELPNDERWRGRTMANEVQPRSLGNSMARLAGSGKYEHMRIRLAPRSSPLVQGWMRDPQQLTLNRKVPAQPTPLLITVRLAEAQA